MECINSTLSKQLTVQNLLMDALEKFEDTRKLPCFTGWISKSNLK